MTTVRSALPFLVAGALVVGWNLGPRLSAAQAAMAVEAPDPDNGARIYFTGVSGRDGPVMYTGGPEFGGMMMGMMNSRLTCAACHGPEGRGGVHSMHMYVMKAPDIRYDALNAMPEMRGRDHRYDFKDFRAAVADGRHPDGEKLKRDMPRWQMSEADFRDLFAFLKALPQ
jgi:mono/diheme cytochrome c family protein